MEYEEWADNKQSLFLRCRSPPMSTTKQQWAFCHADLISFDAGGPSLYFRAFASLLLPLWVPQNSHSYSPIFLTHSQTKTHILFLPWGCVWLRHEINLRACTLPPLLWHSFSPHHEARPLLCQHHHYPNVPILSQNPSLLCKHNVLLSPTSPTAQIGSGSLKLLFSLWSYNRYVKYI